MQPGSVSFSDVPPTLFPRWDSGCSCIGRSLPIQRGWGKHSMAKTTVLKSIEMTNKRQGPVADSLCSRRWHTVPRSQLGLKHREPLHGGWPGQITQSKAGNISTEHLPTWPLKALERQQCPSCIDVCPWKAHQGGTILLHNFLPVVVI